MNTPTGQAGSIPGPTPKKRAKTELEILMAKVRALKSKILEVTAACTNLVTVIKSGNPSWSWAANDQNLKVLEDAQKAFDKKVDADSFNRSILMIDLKDLRSRWGPEYLIVKFRSFVQLEADLGPICDQRSKLVAMGSKS
jgi:hypothetical protein